MSKVTAITSRANPLLARLRRLAAEPAAYRRHGQVWIEGEHLCSAFVQHGGEPLHAVVTETAWANPALRELAGTAAAVAVVSESLMAGVSALESPPPLAFAIRWLGAGVLRADVASAVLDRVQDAGNVGSILRSAAAFGFAQVIALPGTAALWSPKVVRAAMGAHFVLHLVEGVDEGALLALQMPLLATSPHAARAICDETLPARCAWLFGHEGQGVSPSLLGRCAQTLRIPQPGGQESLNVAAAAAVCFYESARQRPTI